MTRSPAVHLTVLAAVLLFGLGAAPAGAAAQPSFDRERLSRVADMIDTHVAAGKLPGAIVQVTAADGDILFRYAAGHADIEAERPLRPDTLFRIASQTKAITSVAAMMLVEEGKLRLDQPLSDIFPGWASAKVATVADDGTVTLEPAARPITIRHLLTHTSGLTYGREEPLVAWQEAGYDTWYFADHTMGVPASVREMASLPLMGHPGDTYRYGYSSDVLGAVVAEVSGISLREFFATRIFEPLRMTDTDFCVQEEDADRLAAVYGYADGELSRASAAQDAGSDFRGQGDYVAGPCVAFSGGAGLVSTTRDYTRFLLMLLNGGSLDGEHLLSRKTVDLMTEGEIPMSEERLGRLFSLAFSVTTDLGESGALGSVGNYGWGGAYHTRYWVDPEEGFVVTYMTQVIPAQDLHDHSLLQTLLYQALE